MASIDIVRPEHKPGLWERFAKFLTNHPGLVDALVSYAEAKPYFHILNNGDLYMRRFWLMPRFLLRQSKHGHLEVKPWVPFAIRIHHIVRPDSDRDLHDRPFNYRTFILDGWYIEEDIYGVKRWRSEGQTVSATAQTFHRIDQVSPGGVWTLFAMGRRTNGWGFLVGGHKVPYRKYLGLDGGDAA